MAGRRSLLIGLTGGTGSGKSTVARELARCGARVIDADQLAREVVEPGTPGLAAIVAEFGDNVVDAAGSLRRAHLAEIVFADPARLRALETITHPLIEARTADLVAAAGPGDVVVHDMPLIVERGTAPQYHLVLVVDAPVDLRVERLAGRGMDPADARRRIANQATPEQRRAVADVWLDNSGSPDDLAAAARRLWESRLHGFSDNVRLGRHAARPAKVVDSPDPAWSATVARVAARLQSRLGISVTVEPPADLPAEDILVAALKVRVDEDLLAGCGFFPYEQGRFAGADPGLAVDVLSPG